MQPLNRSVNQPSSSFTGKQATPTTISTVLPIPTISHTLEDGKLKESSRIAAGLQRGNEEGAHSMDGFLD